jgi:Spy/CpxP family protein refolding chaperone
MKNITKPMLLAALMAVGGLPASAQPAPGPAATEQSQPRPAQMRERMKERMLKRAQELKAKLKLSPEQQPAWESYMAAMKPSGLVVRPSPAEMEKLTTPERLDKMREMRQQRDAEMDRRIEATKAYYATLTPEQRTIFDAHTARMRHDFRPRAPR